MHVIVDIIIVDEDKVTPKQKDEMLRLQIACFADQVTAEEVEEDFDRPPIARVLAYHQGSLIACAEVFKREVEYDGQAITLGGFAPGTGTDWRGQGIGTRVCKTAMDYLRHQGCDMAFLSVDTERETHPLYERLGFRMLPKPFIYANIRGELKESEGGMIVPLCSPELFEQVLHGESQLALTPEVGYW
ncbi:MAG: GNAT family N-acetyltransferase [Anaerolineae bacterium]|nr:GNAT family N-acetyltransferase [Anaerolineae bacterium]